MYHAGNKAGRKKKQRESKYPSASSVKHRPPVEHQSNEGEERDESDTQKKGGGN